MPCGRFGGGGGGGAGACAPFAPPPLGPALHKEGDERCSKYLKKANKIQKSEAKVRFDARQS